MDINGTRVEVAEQGAGESVVFVHGSESDHRTWQSQLTNFGDQHRSIAYSRRYHWPNDRIPDSADYSMREHVDDLQAFLRSLDSDAVHLVGHSSAARRGDMDAAMRIFGTAVLGPEFYRRLSSSRLEQVRANAIKAEFLGSGFAPLNDEDVRAIQVPTLLISGKHSPRFFHRLLDRLEELLPHSDRVEIDGASHLMHEDNGAAYNGAVRAFLSRHPAASYEVPFAPLHPCGVVRAATSALSNATRRTLRGVRSGVALSNRGETHFEFLKVNDDA